MVSMGETLLMLRSSALPSPSVSVSSSSPMHCGAISGASLSLAAAIDDLRRTSLPSPGVLTILAATSTGLAMIFAVPLTAAVGLGIPLLPNGFEEEGIIIGLSTVSDMRLTCRGDSLGEFFCERILMLRSLAPLWGNTGFCCCGFLSGCWSNTASVASRGCTLTLDLAGK